MTLLVTVFAAVIATVVWYHNAPNDVYKLPFLCLMYWGASLMWFVDGVFGYIDRREYYFIKFRTYEIINDAFLGLSVVALGLVIWLVYLLIKDPKGVLWKKRR